MVSLIAPTCSVRSTRLIWPTLTGTRGSHRLAESLQRDPDDVRAGLDVGERVGALRVGGGFACEVGLGVDDDDPGPGDDRALGIDRPIPTRPP